MKKGNSTDKRGNVEFWQSATDLLLAMLLVMLLVVSLLLLYILQLPEENRQYLWGTDQSEGINDYTGQPEWRRDDDGGHWIGGGGDWDGDDDGGGGGGGGGGESRPTETTLPTWPSETTWPTETTETTWPTESGGIGGDGHGDEWAKAAVLSTIIDGETNRAIREANITFELYQVYNIKNGARQGSSNDQGTIRYLNSYYPEKVEYRVYKTDPDGLYYLPEKIESGGYYFKQVTELAGYDDAEADTFEIDREYDWNDPYVVSIPLYPSRNVIRVRLLDADTGEYLTDGTFLARAAENIITADGTTRFITGAVADVFTLDTGLDYGESSEIYLGTYTVEQDTAPRYYTTMDDTVEVTLVKKNGIEPEVLEFSCRKTAIRIHVSDDLYAAQPIEGAVFTLSASGLPDRQGVTDANGDLVFTELEKNTSYTLLQTSAPGDYQPDTAACTILVDMTGRILGEADISLELTNFVPRVSIGLQDLLLKTNVSGKSLSLYDSGGRCLRSWTTTAADEAVTGLDKGSYYVLIDNREDARFDFTVDDPTELKTVHYSIWTLQAILTIGAGVVIVPLVFYFIILLFKGLLGGRRKSRF